MKRSILVATAGLLGLAATLNPAMADNGKANGHATTHGNSANAHSTHSSASTASTTTHGKGGLASELKGLNAVKANPNALEHASPNSQVGRIAAYRDAALATAEQQTLLDEAVATKALLPVPRADLDIQTDIVTAQGVIDGIDAAIAAALLEVPPGDVAQLEADRLLALDVKAGFDQELADAGLLNQALDDAQVAIDVAQANVDAGQGLEDDALLIASGGRVLSDEAIAYIRSMLNL